MTPVAIREAPAGWRTLLRAMGLSALGAAASGLFSAAASKIIAVALGPAAIAILTTLQQIRQAAVTVSTANGQTALVQGGSALGGLARREYLRTAAVIFTAATGLSVFALLLAPSAIARWAGLGGDSTLVRSLAPVALLSSLFVFETALLNAKGAIGKLAALQIAGPAALVMGALTAARLGSSAPAWFPAMLAFSAGIATACAGWALRGEIPREWFRGIGRIFSAEAAGHFFSISGAMLGTGLAGSAALIAVRAWIARRQGLAVTGQFDAAWAISMNQVSLVLASLQTYFLRSLAQLHDPEDRGRQIRSVLTAAAPVAALAIAILALTKPLLLRLLLSPAFADASRYLRWTLLGDYLKVTSWILSAPMLASAHMRVFIAADLSATAAFVISAAALAAWKSPAESAAIAFVIMHAVHLGFCSGYARRRHAFTWGGRAALTWVAGLALVSGASAWSWSF